MIDNWTFQLLFPMGVCTPFFGRQSFPHFVATLPLTISRCFISLSASENEVAVLTWNFTSFYLKSWQGWIKKARVSSPRVFGCQLDEMRGPSWPFVLPAGAQFVGGGACKMQAHSALRSACAGFCAVVCKPGWKISVTKQMGSVCNKSDTHGVALHGRCAVPCRVTCCTGSGICVPLVWKEHLSVLLYSALGHPGPRVNWGFFKVQLQE